MFVALVLFIPTFPLLDWPLTGWIEGTYGWVWDHLVQAIARYVLRPSFPVPHGPMDGGDTSANWIMLSTIPVLGVIGAAIWTSLDRRRSHPRLKEWLDVAVRFTLGLTMFRYGLIKLFPLQFGNGLQFRDYLQPLGDLTPLALLWRTMGYSRVYVIFAGMVEVIGGCLLFWRRTTTLGALLSLAAITQVLVLDVSYDVIVKGFAASLLVMSLYLLAPRAIRLARIFVLNLPVGTEDITPHFSVQRTRRMASIIKTVAIVAAIANQVRMKAHGADFGPQHPLRGVYDVDTLAYSAGMTSDVFMPGEKWTRLAIESSGYVTVWTDDGRHRAMLAQPDSGNAKMVIASAPANVWEGPTVGGLVYTSDVMDAFNEVPNDASHRVTLTYDTAPGGHVRLMGRRAADSVVLRLSRWPESRITLRGCPVHIIHDRTGPTKEERCPWIIR